MKEFSISVRENYGWRLYEKGDIRLWFSGYFYEKTIDELLNDILSFSHNSLIEINELSLWVESLSGHFAFIIDIDKRWCFSAVDKISSIPLYEKYNNSKYFVSNYAPTLRSDKDKLNLNSILEISMSGYTLGRKTIYMDINRFYPGECCLWIKGNIHRKYYYTYLPKQASNKSENTLKGELTETLLSVLKDTIKTLNGRQVVIPLSAGNDSRLIASGLKNLNYENVICFSYGRKGNYELETSKKVAEKLGYKWVCVPLSLKLKRNFFLSDLYKNYLEEFESYSSVPNIQDIYEVFTLHSLKIIESNAVVINGNTGDFISGGHIPYDLNNCNKESSLGNFDWSPFMNKHYSIWRKLRNNINDNIIISELKRTSNERLNIDKLDNLTNYSLFECMESLGRQSRFVLNQQRSYEFIGHEWRLPLWHEDVLNFWKSVPPEQKLGQKLYINALRENNWGDVWLDIEINNKLIRPRSLKFLRLILKFLIAPFGKHKWHSIEKNIFVYWLHPTYGRAIESYRKVLFDRRGQRNTLSWLADKFVIRLGFKGVMHVSKNIKDNTF